MTNFSRPSEAAEAPSGRRAFARFLVAGAVNTAVSYALFVALERVLAYPLAYAIAYVAGIAVSYVLGTAFVFRVRSRWSTALRFPLVYVVQFVLGSAVIAALVEGAGVAPWLAALAAIGVTIPATFVMSRWLLRGPDAKVGG